jgi:hypothetical protein
VATAPALDTAGGILGGAKPTAFRPGAHGLQWKGEMLFDTADVQGAGKANLICVGANALREYRTLFGEPRATGVPLETTGGQRTANSHWSESFLVNELMAGFIERPGEPHCRRNRRGLAGSGGGGDAACVRILGGPAAARRAGAGCSGSRLTAGWKS